MEEKVVVRQWRQSEKLHRLFDDRGELIAYVSPMSVSVWATHSRRATMDMVRPEGMSVEDARRACEQALRDAGYRFADDPPRGSMTRGLPLADELDPATYLPHAIAALHDVLRVGAERYPDERWKTQNVAEHLRHAREHIRLHTIGDESEPHLRHALTRLAFAVEIAEGGGK